MRLSRRQLLRVWHRALLGAVAGPAVLGACSGLPEALGVPASLRASTPTPTGPRQVRTVQPAAGGFLLGDRAQALFRAVRPERNLLFRQMEVPAFPGLPGRAPSYAEVLAAFPPDARPDLVFLARDHFPGLARAGSLLDLGPLLTGQAWFKVGDYLEGALRAVQVRGKRLALPLEVSVDVAVRSERAFGEAGVAPPGARWDWEAFAATAKRLTRPGRWGCFVSPYWPSLYPPAWQLGADLVSEDGARWRLDEPGTLRALELLAGLIHDEQVAPPLDEDVLQTYEQFDPGWVALVAGRAAMTGARVGRSMAWRSGYDAVVTPMPTTGRGTGLATANVMVGIPTNAPDAAHSLHALRALVEASPEAFMLPARREGADPRRIDASLSEAEAEVLKQTAASARFLPGDVPSSVTRVVVRELVVPVLTRAKRPAQAARDALPLVEAEAAKFR
jgi:ABC-type glycerol-3-phosphate transport system substrate-binding protein